MGKFPANLPVGIIGGGAAGMSCALWLTQLGYPAVIIEHAGQLGGQLLSINRVNRWLLGFPEFTSAELAGRYAEHIAKTPASLYFNSRIQAIDSLPNEGYRLQFTGNGKAQALTLRALVIATGVRFLGAETFNSLAGFTAVHQAGLISFFPLDHLDQLKTLKGRQVAVIGGGDNAYYTAKDIALAGAHVHLIRRSPPKAQPGIRAEVAALAGQGRITEYEHTVITAFRLNSTGIALFLNQAKAFASGLNVERVFVRIGFTANSEFLDEFTAFSGLNKENGYICTDAGKRTNAPWLYAIGDVANPRHQSVVGALADGALAAQDYDGRKT